MCGAAPLGAMERQLPLKVQGRRRISCLTWLRQHRNCRRTVRPKFECPRGGHWAFGVPLAASRRIPRRAGDGAPHSPFASRANRSAARAGTRAFRGINGPLPTRAALRSSRAGPFHLFHGALAPALVRGAIGLARRKADAGQESLPRQLQRRGINSHERLPRNWSRGGKARSQGCAGAWSWTRAARNDSSYGRLSCGTKCDAHRDSPCRTPASRRETGFRNVLQPQLVE